MKKPTQQPMFEGKPAPTERQLQTAIEKAMTKHGWWHMHVRRMQTPDGRWMTGTSEPGWLDIFAIKGRFTLAIEVKGLRGRATPAQLAMLERHRAAGHLAWLVSPRTDRYLLAGWIEHPSQAPLIHGWTPEPR